MSSRQRRDGERGSALMLMPAAVLIVVVLGAIAVDFALVFLAQREVSNVAAAAANDVAGAAVDLDAFFDGQGLVLDNARAQQVGQQSVAARDTGFLDTLTVAVIVDEDEVEVTVTGSVTYLFAAALPAGPKSATVNGIATAVAEQR